LYECRTCPIGDIEPRIWGASIAATRIYVVQYDSGSARVVAVS